MVVVGFAEVAPLSFLTSSREAAIKAIKDLPKTEGKPYLYKVAFYKGRIYGKRQHKID